MQTLFATLVFIYANKWQIIFYMDTKYSHEVTMENLVSTLWLNYRYEP